MDDGFAGFEHTAAHRAERRLRWFALLENYPGMVLFASHNRRLVQTVAT
ncbi:MAG: hypothetical protein HC933_01165 [Pleurocapsa sp. SU_196_0]|nr:hypothetical protein [Pleurocapsa sp. SU_196_0]